MLVGGPASPQIRLHRLAESPAFLCTVEACLLRLLSAVESSSRKRNHKFRKATSTQENTWVKSPIKHDELSQLWGFAWNLHHHAVIHKVTQCKIILSGKRNNSIQQIHCSRGRHAKTILTKRLSPTSPRPAAYFCSPWPLLDCVVLHWCNTHTERCIQTCNDACTYM